MERRRVRARSVVAAVAALALPVPVAAADPLSTTGGVVFSSDRCEQGGVPMVGGPNPDRPPCRSSIFTVRADGSARTRLTTGGDGASGDFSPAWSPAGNEI